VGSRKPIRYLATILGVTAMASLAAIPLAGVTAGTVAAASTARMTPADYNGGPLFRHTSAPKQGLFSCQAPASPTNTLPCYGPAQIRRAYNIPSNLTGAGKTIVIIDAFGNPDIASDLALFDSTFDLPPANLNIICITGTCPTFDPNNADQQNWAGEIALDTQWSHADAPGATIDLVISRSDQDSDILAAQQYVVNHNLGDVLSQSFGEGETCMDPSIFAAQHRVFVKAAAEHMTVFASAGDSGSAQPDCNNDGGYFLSASTPASDPLVTGVGGTHLNADFTTGQYQSESVWNDSGTAVDIGAGGGGFSTKYPRPSYQAIGNRNAARGVPDVAFNADIFGGVLGVCSACGFGPGAFFIFAGTSSGSPQWSAITALADQAAGGRLGFLNPVLYVIGVTPTIYNFAFHDITTGNNAWDVTGVPGYSASRGWDPATGLGSPNAAHLISLLSHGNNG
jgi:subtilase family serine protease